MTATLTQPQSTRALSALSFGGILKSELIKLLSLRSTVWCFGLVFVMTLGLAGLVANASGGSGPVPAEGVQAIWVQSATIGIVFAQLVVAVLGTLTITGEYGTGMIRSTLTAVPRRTPALTAKALVIGASTFAVSLVALLGSGLLSAMVLQGQGIEVDFADASVWWALLGGAGYLGLLAMLSLSIGAIVRNSAGGISAVLGLILVLPIVLSIFAALAQADWVRNLSAFLPDSNGAGGRMFSYTVAGLPVPPDMILLEPWQGLVVLVIWVIALFALAGVMIKRRDV
ncbi:ABC transporter permease [Salinibacterium sp.]|uniref:ABC transporter permease n=1 Tax=Salinibacterium sp. TaxID=1915057 RepID=UPI00286A3537|nr:ABC transporter permease [Salinibacterium sp.]